jgi:hypothetical protein
MQRRQELIFWVFIFFLLFFVFFQKFFKNRVKNLVATNAPSLQYLRSKDLLSALRSKFVKINDLFFKN